MSRNDRLSKGQSNQHPQPVHPSLKQEKALIAICIVVAVIMLLSLSRYMFR